MLDMKHFRAALMIGVLTMGSVFTGAQAQAFDTDEAKSLTRTLVDEVLTYIDADMSQSEKITEFKDTMNRFADMSTIARYTLGVAWRSASEAQQSAYVTAFQDYIANKYGRQFDSFNGETIDIQSALDAGQKGIVVSSLVNRPGQEPVVVEWQFSDRSGSPRLVDIIVEGVSLLTTERQEIGSKLEARGGDLDRLIRELPEAGLGTEAS